MEISIGAGEQHCVLRRKKSTLKEETGIYRNNWKKGDLRGPAGKADNEV